MSLTPTKAMNSPMPAAPDMRMVLGKARRMTARRPDRQMARKMIPSRNVHAKAFSKGICVPRLRNNGAHVHSVLEGDVAGLQGTRRVLGLMAFSITWRDDA